MHHIFAGILLWAGLQSPTATLVIQVVPEARVMPSEVALDFRDHAAQVVVVAARVRAVPGKPIRLTATQTDSLPLQWTGSVAAATGGASHATCSSGSFASGPVQDIAVNWTKSGSLTCTLVFSLPPGLLPGPYTTSLTLQAQ